MDGRIELDRPHLIRQLAVNVPDFNPGFNKAFVRIASDSVGPPFGSFFLDFAPLLETPLHGPRFFHGFCSAHRSPSAPQARGFACETHDRFLNDTT